MCSTLRTTSTALGSRSRWMLGRDRCRDIYFFVCAAPQRMAHFGAKVLETFLARTGSNGSILGGCEGGSAVSRLILVITAIAVGAVLAVGASLATTAAVSSPPTPSNQAAYNYGS